MNLNQTEDILSIEEILKGILTSWRSLLVISVLIFTLSILFYNFSKQLYKSSVIIIPSGDNAQSSSSSILAAIGGFAGTPVVQDNSEKIKLYAKSSQVLQNVLKQLDPKDLDVLRPWLNSHYFGLKQGLNETSQDLRQLAFKLAKFITIQTPNDATSALQISIETPSHKISDICITLLIEELRNFYNEIEQEKRQKLEEFFESESIKYREKMFLNSLEVSRLSRSQNPQSGFIEIQPTDLGIGESIQKNIRTTPQAYFEYKSTLQEMYKSFAKTLEQNFQSVQIDGAKKSVLFDVIETAYGSENPSSPNLLKYIFISVVIILFIFTFVVFVMPTLKSILFEKQN